MKYFLLSFLISASGLSDDSQIDSLNALSVLRSSDYSCSLSIKEEVIFELGVVGSSLLGSSAILNLKSGVDTTGHNVIIIPKDTVMKISRTSLKRFGVIRFFTFNKYVRDVRLDNLRKRKLQRMSVSDLNDSLGDSINLECKENWLLT